MEIDSREVDEKPLMASRSKLIIKIKVGDNGREFAVHRDKEDKEEDERLRCSLCGKIFPSRKSLFGHMRCHPDRDYGGMRPPDAFQFAVGSQPLTAVDDRHHHRIDRVDLLRRLPGWPVKAKRSCIRATGYNEDLMVKGAAYGLMLMATGNHRYRYLDDEEIEDRDELQKSSSIHEQNCADSDNMKTGPRKRKRQTAKDKDREQSEHQIDNPGAAAAAKCYKCNICDKAFANYQALGGHTSSAHSKPHQFDGIHDASVSQPPPPSTASELSHICKTCDKAFPSGQALGGHMRLHWAGPSPPLSSSSRPVLVFDLNQLPLPAS